MTFLLRLIFGLSLCLNVWSTDSSPTEDEEGFIRCKCGVSKKEWTKPLDLKLAKKVFEHIVNTGVNLTSLVYYPESIRYFFKNCETCEISHSVCVGSSETDDDDYFCDKHTAVFNIPKNEIFDLEYRDLVKYALEKITAVDMASIGQNLVKISKREVEKYPLHVHIPIGGLKTRLKRHMQACHYPTSLQTAELNCVHYPSKVKCTQKCAFGYAIRSKKKMDYTCKKKENKWKPHNFHECQPFIDCTVTLISGGSSKCQSATLEKGPVCTIKCDKYEDKPAVPSKKYKCNIHGKWEPSLPFCAHPGSGLDLLEKPDGKASKSDES